jgi:tryptophan-rich sensory protein
MESYTYTQYAEFIKPDWAPPAWLFGPVWSVLYLIIAISFGYVFYKWIRKELPFSVVLPFGLNLIFNIIFTPIQFGLQNNLLAAIDIILVLGTLVWLMVAIWKKYRWVALANIPYLAWVSFATVLQLTILYLN